MKPVISLHNVTLSYHRHPAVHHVSGTFHAGEATAIIGPNGAGKSTLLKAIVGLIPASDSMVQFHGIAKKDIAFLPQAANIDRTFPISVLDAVLLGNWRKSGWFGGVSKTARAEAEAALIKVGLEGFGPRHIGSLSSGQFQRVLFARILLQNSPLILLDEPFTAIDARTTQDLLHLIDHWRYEGRTIISVLHDYEQVKNHFSESLLMAKECIAWGPTTEVLTKANLQKANAMAENWIENAAVCHRDEQPQVEGAH
ncbi:ABC transporter ATP-binding protein [Leeia sp. TBRC 13508]|uniref:ABC transporter ATP-binding protein n=1 Tax=Leeia speluncae TaxID=2884804 RepID=A0ABS8D3M6_9NEIS|nr:ABC transporter ATP-binding protein [Leeia speluncae]MCB6182797.1 ABC transporter ATP-binding protein [Leeia speluncae]